MNHHDYAQFIMFSLISQTNKATNLNLTAESVMEEINHCGLVNDVPAVEKLISQLRLIKSSLSDTIMAHREIIDPKEELSTIKLKQNFSEIRDALKEKSDLIYHIIQLSQHLPPKP